MSIPYINYMADSLVKTMKRGYIAFMTKPNARTALQNLAAMLNHYIETIRAACWDIVFQGNTGTCGHR
ncbi:hypothetical protein LE36_06720 [Salmonella enterica subsp. diarizonae]|nr:hypothetical protein [Salmonella enterica subsp. diarizonae]